MRPSDVGIILSELRGALGSRLASTGALAEWMTAKFADRIREQQEAWKARGASLAPANRFPSVRPARASAPPLLGGGAPAAPLDEADVAAIREFFSVSSPPPPFAAESPTNPTASTLPRAAFPSVPPPSVGVLGPQGTPSPSDAAIQVEVDDGRRDELTSPGLRAVSRQKRRRVIVAVITAACACLATVAAGVAVRAPSRPNVPPPRHAAPVLSVPPSSDTTATPAAAPDATQLAQPADSETAAPTPLPTVATPLTNPALPQLSPRPPPTAGGTGKTAPAQPAATSAATPGKAQGKNNYDPLGI